MNLVIINENISVMNSLTIDIIKTLTGVYDVSNLEQELVNFYFNKVIIDITAIKNYFFKDDLLAFLNYFGKDKVIIVLNDSEYCNSKLFLSTLIENGYYNFTKNAQGVSFLISKPNTYDDVKKYLYKEDTFTSALTSNISAEDERVKDNFNTTSIVNNVKNEKKTRVIGVQDLYPGAGATTLMQQMVKQLAINYNAMGIELSGHDTVYFRNNKILFCANMLDAKAEIRRHRDVDVFVIDLCGLKDKEGLCDDVIYLLEPGIIRLSKFIKYTDNLNELLDGKKIVLNRSALKDDEMDFFESQTGIKVFYNLINFDDRKERLLSVDKLLIKLGFDKQER